MNNRQTQFLEDPLKAVRPEKFSAAVIYETAADGIRAKLFSDQVIAMTANVMPGDRERCLAAGMDEFLSKPFNKDDLAAKLDWTQHNCFGCKKHESDRCLEEST